MTHAAARPSKKRFLVAVLALIGVVLLVVGVVSALVGNSAIKGFSRGDGADVSADKAYYLLADEGALAATSCGFFDADERSINNLVVEIVDLTDDSGNISDVSLPLTNAKGVYGRVVFAEDIAGAHISCDDGKNYLSAMSGTTLGVLRWSTILGLVGGIAFLLAALLLRRPDNDVSQHNSETPVE